MSQPFINCNINNFKNLKKNDHSSRASHKPREKGVSCLETV